MSRANVMILMMVIMMMMTNIVIVTIKLSITVRLPPYSTANLSTSTKIQGGTQAK